MNEQNLPYYHLGCAVIAQALMPIRGDGNDKHISYQVRKEFINSPLIEMVADCSDALLADTIRRRIRAELDAVCL